MTSNGLMSKALRGDWRWVHRTREDTKQCPTMERWGHLDPGATCSGVLARYRTDKRRL